MKLAEVATGGAWTFDDTADKKKESGAAADSNKQDKEKKGDAAETNGHEKVTDVDDEEDEDDGGLRMGDKAVVAAENGAGAAATPSSPEGPPAAAAEGEGDPEGDAVIQARKPDPVHEVCPDLQVKIADLGNACWVVRRREKKEIEICNTDLICVYYKDCIIIFW